MVTYGATITSVKVPSRLSSVAEVCLPLFAHLIAIGAGAGTHAVCRR
jgi:hypothetical protein